MKNGRSNRSIAVMVPCTKRKHWSAPLDLRFHTLPVMPVRLLAKEWLLRVTRAENRYPAIELYYGLGWSTAVTASGLVREKLGAANLFIMSAGFGFLRPSDLLPSYSATFAMDEDRVANRIEGTSTISAANREWWNVMRELRSEDDAVCLSEIASNDYVIVAAGRDYLEAIAGDLKKLAITHGGERLLVISVGTRRESLEPVVRDCLLPIDVSIENVLRGARSTLNQRVLSWLVDEVIPQESWERNSINSAISKKLAQCRLIASGVPARRVMRIDDGSVKAWILTQVSSDSDVSKRKLLKTFRQNRSCEEKRFYRLVDSVLEVMR